MQLTPLMQAVGPVLDEHRPPGSSAWIAVALVTVSTLAGAWLARRESRRVVVWLATASATMLITAVTDMLPDAWREAAETGVPLWVIGVAAVTGFLVITYFTRRGCGHDHGPDSRRPAGRHAPGRHRRLKEAVGAALFGGMGTAAALTTHRAIEGATLALSASVVVVIALMVHSASEGLALAALLDMAKQRLAPWLVVSCVSPVVGVAFATVSHLPSRVVPVLLGMVTGVLLRTAIVGLKLAASRQESGRLSKRHVAVATVTSIIIGALLTAAHADHGEEGHGHGRAGPGRPAGHQVEPTTPLVQARQAATPRPGTAHAAGDGALAELASGRSTLAEVLERDETAVEHLRVTQLLRALPEGGTAKVEALVTAGLIDDDLRLDALNRRQHRRLLKALTRCAQASPRPGRSEPARSPASPCATPRKP